MIKAVIFDLDGVLVTTDELHYNAWKKIGEEIGINNFTREDNIRQRGVSRMASLEILLEKTDKEYSETEKVQIAEKKNEYYVKSLENLTGKDVLSGVCEVIEALKKMGVKTAVGSASKNAPMILKKTGLLSLIDEVACGLDITKSKPDPEVFIVAANKLGIPCEECLVVEDSDAGIEAAKNAGMYALAVGAAKDNNKADFSAEGLCEIEYVKNIVKSHI